MKKFLVLIIGTLCFFSCTKQYITEEHIHENDYCIIDKTFNNANVAIIPYSYSDGKNGMSYGFDTIRFIKKDKTNILHLVRTLSVNITPKTYGYETNLIQYDTTYYWYNNNPNYPNDVFNFYIKQDADDEIKTSSRHRQVKFRPYTEAYKLCQDRKYFSLDWQLQWDYDNYATIIVKDTIIDIVCPHKEIEREYYYYKYSK